ncbi:hypothetical protein F5Y09DRAFT_314699 [Xylaria sp. FL1042]|nr:hypothetical protein F5Y09DRAFT_314699 [Xylaria sp. FL1042]
MPNFLFFLYSFLFVSLCRIYPRCSIEHSILSRLTGKDGFTYIDTLLPAVVSSIIWVYHVWWLLLNPVVGTFGRRWGVGST